MVIQVKKDGLNKKSSLRPLKVSGLRTHTMFTKVLFFLTLKYIVGSLSDPVLVQVYFPKVK